MNLFTTKASLVFVAFFILLSTKQLSAQESNDLEGWSALQIDIKVTKKLSFSVAKKWKGYTNSWNQAHNHSYVN